LNNSLLRAVNFSELMAKIFRGSFH